MVQESASHLERSTSKSDAAKAATNKTVNDEKIFAVPLKVEDLADCYFYHTMELPGHGVIEGRDWDLREGVDKYLGKVDFARQRVLEIGPASGFLTFEMEKRGAEVVSVEVTAEHGWDFVPYPAERLEEVFGQRRIVMQQLKNSYWFSHVALQSKAKVYYGDVYNLPASLGQFDVAVMGSVLLHCRDPLRIVEQCGKMARTLIVVDMFHQDLEGAPVCRLAPTPENFLWHTWWHFSTQFFTQFLAIMDFTTSETLTHQQYHRGKPYTLFTIVARRHGAGIRWASSRQW
jgi:SAM-dependent methyltransferase